MTPFLVFFDFPTFYLFHSVILFLSTAGVYLNPAWLLPKSEL